MMFCLDSPAHKFSFACGYGKGQLSKKSRLTQIRRTDNGSKADALKNWLD
jgi:hypothetical protein